jgi:hypothetical protein
MRTRRYRHRRKSRGRKKRGGTYYRYNTNPRLFSQSSKMWGGESDPRYVPFQQTANLFRGFGHSISNLVNDFQGHYHEASPSPLDQPIGKN